MDPDQLKMDPDQDPVPFLPSQFFFIATAELLKNGGLEKTAL